MLLTNLAMIDPLTIAVLRQQYHKQVILELHEEMLSVGGAAYNKK